MFRRSVRSGAAIAFAAFALLLACSGGGSGDKTKSCTPGAERCDCRGDGTCDTGLTCASNLCVQLPGTGGTGGGKDAGGGGAGGSAAAGGAGGASGAAGAGGAGGTVADSGADACTFACPTGSHWVEGTFKFGGAFANLQPVSGETVSILMSFDEGATFKDPPTSVNNFYRTRILLSGLDLKTQGDTSGELLKDYNSTTYFDATLFADYSTKISFAAAFGPQGSGNGLTMDVSCQDAPLQAGADQYPIIAPFSCAAGHIRVTLIGADQYGQHGVLDVIEGDGAFKFH